MGENYQIKLDGQLKNLGGKASLLLHACCAPCSSYVLEYLSGYFDITLLYYNPNISPQEEFEKRAHELERFVNEFPHERRIEIVVPHYDGGEFDEAVKGHENDAEGGERCRICYRQRMEAAAKYAAENSYDFFTTTLSISPHKNSLWLNQIGEDLERAYHVKYLYADFKKRGGYKRSCELAAEYGLYRQDYCGCKYSKRDAKTHAKTHAETE